MPHTPVTPSLPPRLAEIAARSKAWAFCSTDRARPGWYAFATWQVWSQFDATYRLGPDVTLRFVVASDLEAAALDPHGHDPSHVVLAGFVLEP